MTLTRLRSLPWLLALGAMVVLGFFFIVSGRTYLERQDAVQETVAAREAMSETLSLLTDAETGVRGFLLTEHEAFLEPYDTAHPRIFKNLGALQNLGIPEPWQRASAERVALLARQKLAILEQLILRKRKGQLLASDAESSLEHGKALMDAIRVEIGGMLARTDRELAVREHAVASARLDLQLVVGAALFGGLVLALGGLGAARRDAEQARSISERLERDVAAREEAEARLRDQTALLESVLANIGDAVLVVDHGRRVVMMNPAASRVASYDVGTTLSAEWSKQVETFLPDGKTLFPPEDGPLTRALEGHPSDGVEMVIRVITGELRSFSVTTRPMSKDGAIVAAVAVFRDTTELKQREAEILEKSEQLRALSLRDELTGLHNRRGFMEVAEHQLKAATRAQEPCAVFFTDLNGMKQINDELGHEMGDHALRATAAVLTSVFRSSDVVARLGGDEFAVFAGECDELGIATAYARLEHAVTEANATSGKPYRLSISTGAAVHEPGDPRDLLTLMQAADANMYAAKRARHERGSLRVRSG